jgi:hypothetical protein
VRCRAQASIQGKRSGAKLGRRPVRAAPRRQLPIAVTTCRCWASTSMARPAVAPCPSAGARSTVCRVSARRPSRRRAAGD